MAIEPAIMQVISKNTDYSKEKVTIKTFETSIKDIVRKIKGQAGDTLVLVQTGDYISDSLLADIKAGQVAYEPRFEALITDIEDYAATDPRTDLSPYTAYVYTYSAIDNGIIEADDNIIYQILSEIMNNEGYFWERRVSIRDILWYIRNIIVDTGIFGQYEVNWDNYATFFTLTYDTITLQGIYDVMNGGEDSLQLKTYSISVTAGNITTQALASDEILHSIDKYNLYGGTAGSVSLIYVNGGQTTTLKTVAIGITESGAYLAVGSGASINTGLGGSITLGATTSTAGTGSVSFTVRKVAVYT